MHLSQPSEALIICENLVGGGNITSLTGDNKWQNLCPLPPLGTLLLLLSSKEWWNEFRILDSAMEQLRKYNRVSYKHGQLDEKGYLHNTIWMLG